MDDKRKSETSGKRETIESTNSNRESVRPVQSPLARFTRETLRDTYTPHTIPFGEGRKEVEAAEHRLQMIERDVPLTEEVIKFIIGETIETKTEEVGEEVGEEFEFEDNEVVEDVPVTKPVRRYSKTGEEEPSEDSLVSSVEEEEAEETVENEYTIEEKDKKLKKYEEEREMFFSRLETETDMINARFEQVIDMTEKDVETLESLMELSLEGELELVDFGEEVRPRRRKIPSTYDDSDDVD